MFRREEYLYRRGASCRNADACRAKSTADFANAHRYSNHKPSSSFDHIRNEQYIAAIDCEASLDTEKSMGRVHQVLSKNHASKFCCSATVASRPTQVCL